MSVYYPRGSVTGGPEALHQLVHTLRILGHDAYLVPLPGTAQSPRAPEYDAYTCPEAPVVADEPGAFVVAPEIAIHLLRGVTSAIPVCWWLSVDNASILRSERKLKTLPPFGPKNWLRRVKHSLRLPIEIGLRVRTPIHRMEHIAQSSYARSYILARFGVVSSIVGDYTTLPVRTDSPTPERRYITYNQAKGGEFVERFRMTSHMALPSGIEWLPIRGMTRDGVAAALRSSLVYLDLGPQPGKDRLPREAALAGAVCLLAQRGAGAFWEDFPVSTAFKVHDVTSHEEIRAKLEYSIAVALSGAPFQVELRQRTVREREVFECQVRRYFELRAVGDDAPCWSGGPDFSPPVPRAGRPA